MKCPYCGARVKRVEYFCPNCGEKLDVRNQPYPVLKYSLINAALFTFVVPVIIDLIFQVLKISFLYCMLFGWVPGLVLSIYIIRQYMLLAKEGKYPALKGIIATLVNCAVIVFALMMIITTAFDFAHMYTAKKNIESLFDNVEITKMIANTETDEYYFQYYDQDTEVWLVYDMETDRYQGMYPGDAYDIIDEIKENDDGTYFIMK